MLQDTTNINVPNEPVHSGNNEDGDVEKGINSHSGNKLLARAIASYGPPPDVWAATHRPLTSLAAITLQVTNSGEDLKHKRPSLLKGVVLRARLGSSHGVFGGTENARRRVLTILAREYGNRHAAFQIKGETRNKTELDQERLQTVKFGYVHKDNALYPASTPGEEIHLNLSLLYPDLDSEEIQERKEALLKATGLDAVRHKPVMALTDGQRKAMAIALEMVADPDVLVLDEPFATIQGDGQPRQKLHLATLISHLASSKRCIVIYTAAECDAVMYEAAHDVMILSQGPTSTVLFHSAPKTDAVGMHNPDTKVWAAANPVEAILLSSRFSSAQNSAPTIPLNIPRTLAGAIMSAGQTLGRTVPSAISKPSRLSHLWAFRSLVVREFKFTKRDPRLFKARIISAIVVSIFSACIFLYAADQNQANYNPASHIASMMLTIFVHGVATVTINSGIVFSIRPAMLREMAHGVSRPFSIFLARLIPELFVTFTAAIIIMLIMYWSARWSAPFIVFVGIQFLFLETCVSYGQVVGFVAPSLAVANGLSTFLMIPQLFFMGNFVRIRFLPDFMQWASYLCHVTYAAKLMIPEEFTSAKCQLPSTCVQWDAFMDQNMMLKDDQEMNALILSLAFFLGARLLALLVAFKKERALYLKGRD